MTQKQKKCYHERKSDHFFGQFFFGQDIFFVKIWQQVLIKKPNLLTN